MKKIIGNPSKTNNDLIENIKKIKINYFYIKNQKDFRDQVLKEIKLEDDILDIVWHETNIDTDPLFIDYEGNSFMLDENSDCIDQGIDYFEIDITRISYITSMSRIKMLIVCSF